MQSFKEFYNAGAVTNTSWNDYNNQMWDTGKNLPTPTLDLPTQTTEGTIRSIFYTQNPITVTLDNGFTWKLTKEQWDYLKAHGKEPMQNKRVMIELFLDGTIKSVNFI
jgi:hypothetical protein